MFESCHFGLILLSFICNIVNDSVIWNTYFLTYYIYISYIWGEIALGSKQDGFYSHILILTI